MAKLHEIVHKIEKQFYKGVLAKMSEVVKLDQPCVSTGSVGLDLKLGGGIPYSSIVEVYGPEASGKTTLTLSIIKEVLDADPEAKAGFIDAEQKLNPRYCEDMGIDLSRLYVFQPSSGEEGFDMAELLLEADDVKIVVIDSVARMIPQAIIDNDITSSNMGLHARLMSKGLQRIVPAVSKNGAILLFVNQLREKIGVMFGCFAYNARVLLEDGTTEKIGKIVTQKMPVRVMSYNESTGKLEPKKIVNYYQNGKYSQLYKVKVAYPHVSGESKFIVADDHLFPTPSGELKLSELHVGDYLYGKSTSYLNKDQYSLCVGTILGDGSLRRKDNQRSPVVSLRMSHGISQNDYCAWKKGILPRDFTGSESFNKKGELYWETKPTQELLKFYKVKQNKSVSNIATIVDDIDLKALTIWYLDDGNLSGSYQKSGGGKTRIYASKLTEEDKTSLVNRFIKLGIPVPSFDTKGFIWYGKNSLQVQEAFAPFIPKCMEYKLLPRLRSVPKYNWNSSCNVSETLVPCRIKSIEEIESYSKSPYKFDIEVEDNHNYFVDNVLVHNSPETTTGGNSLKYYCMVRLDVRSPKSTLIKNGDEVIGQNLKVKIIKNQFGTPHGKVDFDFIYGEPGFDKVKELVDIAVDYGVMTKSGAYYKYNNESIGQGKANVGKLFKENPDLYNEILSKVEDKIYGKPEETQ
jgi:recombination protein RecA